MKSEARNLNFETIPNDQNSKKRFYFTLFFGKSLCCHSRAGGNLEGFQRCWIPAFAGMTNALGAPLVDFFKKIN